ncbi:MAG: glycine oxidase ThiO [Terriglobales bacterium]
MNHWDAIVIGAGIIGLSLAIELRKQGLRVLVVEKGEPGREASWAAGGMLSDCPLETSPGLQELATASAGMYPEFVGELESESGLTIDLRSVGTLVFVDRRTEPGPGWAGPNSPTGQGYALPGPLAELEPVLRTDDGSTALYVPERCVDPRQLTAAALAAARHRGVELSCGEGVLGVEVENERACGVRTRKTRFTADTVVNCAGAWAQQIAPSRPPTRPVKGQMLAIVMPEKEMVRHVVRTPDVYLIPRSDGRMVIGATAEEAGFDKQTVPETIERLRRAAIDRVPSLADARIQEAWAGLRPGTPDALPILGPTTTRGYFVATGHFRDGILLAPVTAKIMAQIITGSAPELDVTRFSAQRFSP